MGIGAVGKGSKIGIVGAGLGGVTIAALLQRFGYDNVTVFERAPVFSRLGAGIGLGPNVLRIMRLIGCEAEMLRIASVPYIALSREWDTGRVLWRRPTMEWLERYGAHHITMHRGDFHAMLVRSLATDTIKFGKALVGIDARQSTSRLRFEDGTHADADIVIGADGIASKVREILLGVEAPEYSGSVAYRGLFPASLIQDYKIEADYTKWWSDDRNPQGGDRNFLIYYLTQNREEFYFVASAPDPDWDHGTTPVEVGRDEVLGQFRGFHPEIQHMIRACPATSKWPLFLRQPKALWSRGNIVLLGDACHPMLPYMGQGAGMAIEDAAILARCIDAAADDFEEAFALYEANRFERTAKVQKESELNTWMKYDTDPSWVFGYDGLTVPLTPARRHSKRYG
jgi:6-hydroxynicotinate 3-monooxygenase